MQGRLGLAAAAAIGFTPLTGLAQPEPRGGADLFQAVLAAPDDEAANLAYARHAEEAGDLRQALSAYERVARSDPANQVAARGFRRVQALLSPPRTSVTVSAGAAYEADARRIDEPFSGSADGAIEVGVDIEDERTVAGRRLRTLAAAIGDLHVRFEDLNELRAEAFTGPVFALTARTDLHLAVGGAVEWLAHRASYGEAAVRGEISTLWREARQRLAVTFGQRQALDAEPGFEEDAFFVDVAGTFTRPNTIVAGDAAYLQPRLRRSGGGALETAEAGSTFWEVGARVAYFFPIDAWLADLGFSLGLHQREFEEDASDGGDAAKERRDLRLEAGAHLIFRDFFADNVDLAADYRFERNFSSDRDDDYRNHVFGARILWRF